MTEDLVALCINIKKSKELWETEERKQIGHAYSTFYQRTGCLECSGGEEMKGKCIRYYLESNKKSSKI